MMRKAPSLTGSTGTATSAMGSWKVVCADRGSPPAVTCVATAVTCREAGMPRPVYCTSSCTPRGSVPALLDVLPGTRGRWSELWGDVRHGGRDRATCTSWASSGIV